MTPLALTFKGDLAAMVLPEPFAHALSNRFYTGALRQIADGDIDFDAHRLPDAFLGNAIGNLAPAARAPFETIRNSFSKHINLGGRPQVKIDQGGLLLSAQEQAFVRFVPSIYGGNFPRRTELLKGQDAKTYQLAAGFFHALALARELSDWRTAFITTLNQHLLALGYAEVNQVEWDALLQKTLSGFSAEQIDVLWRFFHELVSESASVLTTEQWTFVQELFYNTHGYGEVPHDLWSVTYSKNPQGGPVNRIEMIELWVGMIEDSSVSDREVKRIAAMLPVFFRSLFKPGVFELPQSLRPAQGMVTMHIGSRRVQDLQLRIKMALEQRYRRALQAS